MAPYAACLARAALLLLAALTACGPDAAGGDDGDAQSGAHDASPVGDEGAVDGGDADTDDAEVDCAAPGDTAATPSADDDGDGVPNGEELAAGTDPRDPSSAPAWHPEITARPRLYFDAADLPTLRALRDEGEDGPVLWARVLADANRTLGDLPEDPWRDGTAQRRGWTAEAAAFVGLLEGPEGGRPFTERALAILSEPLPSPWPLNEGFYPESKYDLHEAEALVAACHAYDLLAGTPGVPADALAAARETLTGRVDDFAAIHLQPGAFQTLLLFAQNNHVMKVMGALGVCAIALPDRPGAATEFNEAVSALSYMLLDYQGSPEGGYAEGWNYLAYGGQSWLPLVWAYRRLVGPGGAWPLRCRATVTPNDPRAGTIGDYVDLAAHETTRRIFDNALRTARPDGLMVPTDDANAVPLHGAILAALFDRPAWRWNWRKPAVARYAAAAQVLSFIALATAPEAAPPDLALDAAFPEAGFVTLRSDWGPDATYLHLLVEHGPMRTHGLGHEHADPLSLLLHAHGEPLVIDPGYIDFDHHDLVKRGTDHNIVLIDGAGPGFPIAIGAPLGDAWLDEWRPDAALTTALGRTRYADTTWWRRVVRVDGAWFVVADRLQGDRPHTYTFALNGYGGGEVPDGDFALTDDGATWTRPRASLRAVVAPTEGPATYSERLEEHAPGWGQVRLHSCLDVTADMGAEAGFLSVLWPAAAGAEPPSFSASTPAPGQARVRLDFPDGAYVVADLTVAAPARLHLTRVGPDGALEGEDVWTMEAPDE